MTMYNALTISLPIHEKIIIEMTLTMNTMSLIF
jgi:hypothetical protein